MRKTGECYYDLFNEGEGAMDIYVSIDSKEWNQVFHADFKGREESIKKPKHAQARNNSITSLSKTHDD